MGLGGARGERGERGEVVGFMNPMVRVEVLASWGGGRERFRVILKIERSELMVWLMWSEMSLILSLDRKLGDAMRLDSRCLVRERVKSFFFDSSTS